MTKMSLYFDWWYLYKIFSFQSYNYLHFSFYFFLVSRITFFPWTNHVSQVRNNNQLFALSLLISNNHNLIKFLFFLKLDNQYNSILVGKSADFLNSVTKSLDKIFVIVFVNGSIFRISKFLDLKSKFLINEQSLASTKFY